MMPSIRNTLVALSVAVGSITPVHGKESSSGIGMERPNVLLIMTDDQGYSDVGFNGNPLIRTPIMDRMAFEAEVFDFFYASPVCSPTRASLLTGRYALRTGVIDTQEGSSILPPAEITIAEVLQGAGYRTGMFGKWHLGDNAPARPLDQGFDHALTHIGGMIGAPYSLLDAQSYFDPLLIENGREKQFEGYVVDRFTDAAVDFIRSSGEDPFFVYYAPNTPHHPLTVADRYARPYRDAGLSEDTSRYYGMITNLDDNFGRLLDVLEEVGAADNTVIIFLGDNGTSSLHKQDDLWASGLRGAKTYVYENGIRVPMFIKLPGELGKGSRQNRRSSVEDLMPTILDACGIDPLSEMDGHSLVPLLTGDSASVTERALYFQFHRGTQPEKYRNAAIIRGSHKLVQPVGRGIEPFSRDTMRFELYDLSQDPLEQRDIAAENPQIVNSLKSDYSAWFDEVTAAGYTPVPTWIGEEEASKTFLTRQDWRGGGLFDGDLGYYEIDVRSAGLYQITCRWSELFNSAHAVTLQIGEQELKNQILYAESECRFDEVYLPAGRSKLEAWVEIDGEKNGFRFMEIEKLTDREAFAQADHSHWQEVLFDSGTEDWTEQWFLDGEVGTVTTGPDGMELVAGSEFGNDAHHMVLWTKESFAGDLKIEYDFTRLDQETRAVNILYIQASGSGVGPFAEDIVEWNELRRVPAMRMYYDNMNAYHISYAAFPNDEDTTSYIRARRYMPNLAGLDGTGLTPDYFPTGLFETGVPHHISVIRRSRELFIRIENEHETYFGYIKNTELPDISEGRIGLRQMFTRSARYRNFRVSVPAVARAE